MQAQRGQREWLGPEAFPGVGVAQPVNPAESSWVDQPEVSIIVDRDDQVSVRLERQTRSLDRQLPGHAQVYEKPQVIVQVKNNALPTPQNIIDTPTGDFFGKIAPVRRNHVRPDVFYTQ